MLQHRMRNKYTFSFSQAHAFLSLLTNMDTHINTYNANVKCKDGFTLFLFVSLWFICRSVNVSDPWRTDKCLQMCAHMTAAVMETKTEG